MNVYGPDEPLLPERVPPEVPLICGADWCDQPAGLYTFGGTVGPSARVTVVSGPRADFLGRGHPESMRCVDCCVQLVEQLDAKQRRWTP